MTDIDLIEINFNVNNVDDCIRLLYRYEDCKICFFDAEKQLKEIKEKLELIISEMKYEKLKDLHDSITVADYLK